MRILFYGNGGAGNHGCEAIVRGTAELLGRADNQYTIHSIASEEDRRYGLQEYADILNAKESFSRDFRFLRAYLKQKAFGNYTEMDGLYYLKRIKESAGYADIALSVGGDNYCYDGTDIFSFLNHEYNKAGMKTVLWGCSIEPEVLKDTKIIRDMNEYSLIVARESITYDAVRQIHPNVIQMPDPAFYMPAKPCALDNRLTSKDTIGINISPMIISNENEKGLVYNNYKTLVQYILASTDCNIALIPHVVWNSNDDRVVLRKLTGDFDNNSRLIMVQDQSAPELKYIISRCKVFIGARTHSTIAAYSSCVPTIVAGYSVKAAGIAKDLFGESNTHVLSVQKLKSEKDLLNEFIEIWESRDAVRRHLTEIIPQYLSEDTLGKEALLRMVKQSDQ